MGLIWAAVEGLVVGVIAKFVYPGKDPGGLLMTMLLGVCGGFVAGLIGRTVGWYRPGQGAGIIASVLGAMLILWVYHRVREKPTG